MPVALLHFYDTELLIRVPFVRLRVRVSYTCSCVHNPVYRTRPRCKHFLFWPRSVDRNVGDDREARITRKKWHAPLSGIVYVLSAVRLREIELWKWQWTLVIKWTVVRSNFKWFKIVFIRDIHANSVVNSYEILSRKLQKRKYWRIVWWLVIGVLVHDKRNICIFP